jgi:hypothetical protein
MPKFSKTNLEHYPNKQSKRFSESMLEHFPVKEQIGYSINK